MRPRAGKRPAPTAGQGGEWTQPRGLALLANRRPRHVDTSSRPETIGSLLDGSAFDRPRCPARNGTNGRSPRRTCGQSTFPAALRHGLQPCRPWPPSLRLPPVGQLKSGTSPSRRPTGRAREAGMRRGQSSWSRMLVHAGKSAGSETGESEFPRSGRLIESALGR